MIIFLTIIALIILIVLIIFCFPQFSPIPYFPSNKKDLPLILKALNIQDDQTVIDLGAGDGIIIFSGALESYKRNLNTLFIAVDINPILIFILHMRRLFHPNKKNIRIIRADMFAMDFNKLLTTDHSLLTFYLYVSPRFLEPLTNKIRQLDKTKSIVSYFYPVKSLHHKEKNHEGVHSLYIYDNV